jgi:putative hydrolase of the HAD superfamily
VHGWSLCRAAEWFDATVFSFEVGVAKPAPQIYLEALRRLEVSAPSAVFIGDGGDDELLGAERAGVRAVQANWLGDELLGLPARIPRLSSWQSVLDLVTAG